MNSPSSGVQRRPSFSSPRPRKDMVMPRLNASTVLGILRENGVPEDEARRLVESDPRLRAELATKLH